VVGRKGSGKSALMKMLYEHFVHESDTHVVKITPKFNTIRTILNDHELKEHFNEEIFFQHTWLRQILLDLLCEIGHKAKGVYCSGSQQFARQIAQDLNRTSKKMGSSLLLTHSILIMRQEQT
jgi:alpha-D-ribose 1-methylphosphonate 5-triphosphate synthase subunit PhnL